MNNVTIVAFTKFYSFITLDMKNRKIAQDLHHKLRYMSQNKLFLPIIVFTISALIIGPLSNIKTIPILNFALYFLPCLFLLWIFDEWMKTKTKSTSVFSVIMIVGLLIIVWASYLASVLFPMLNANEIEVRPIRFSPKSTEFTYQNIGDSGISNLTGYFYYETTNGTYAKIWAVLWNIAAHQEMKMKLQCNPSMSSYFLSGNSSIGKLTFVCLEYSNGKSTQSSYSPLSQNSYYFNGNKTAIGQWCDSIEKDYPKIHDKIARITTPDERSSSSVLEDSLPPKFSELNYSQLKNCED